MNITQYKDLLSPEKLIAWDDLEDRQPAYVLVENTADYHMHRLTDINYAGIVSF